MVWPQWSGQQSVAILLGHSLTQMEDDCICVSVPDVSISICLSRLSGLCVYLSLLISLSLRLNQL